MLDPPQLPNARIAACLEHEYGLAATEIAFLPIGADLNTAVYRITAADGARYFLKLRRGNFPAATVTIPHWLATAGMQAVIAPIPTRSAAALWTALEPFTAVLHPFVNGSPGWNVVLSERQWKTLGAGLKALHAAAVPDELTRTLPRERYSAAWRDRVAAFMEQAAGRTFTGAVASRLAQLLEEKRSIIEPIRARAGELARRLAAQPPATCVCHGDIHAGNVLIDAAGALYIVDWDTLILAPKERDLMFIGGGVGGVWRTDDEVRCFYLGYGPAAIDQTALSYYRFERIVQDIGEICEAIFDTPEDGENQALMLEFFIRQFEPDNVVDIACASGRRLEE